MPKVTRTGEKVTIEMTFLEYRDLTEVLTASGNDAWRHASCTEKDGIKAIRQSNAKAAWEWSNGIGIPPVNNNEVKEFNLEPFKFLSDSMSEQVAVGPDQTWQSNEANLTVTILGVEHSRVSYEYLNGSQGELSIQLFLTHFKRI